MADRRGPDRRRRPGRPALRRDAAPPRLRRRRCGSSAPRPSRPTTGRRSPRACWPAAVEEAATAFRPAELVRRERGRAAARARAERLEPGRSPVVLAGGEQIRYGRLLIATGGAPAAPAVPRGFENVHCLRTLADARRLRAELDPGARLAIVGAGFIGQEVAATALGLGAEVTMIEALEAAAGPDPRRRARALVRASCTHGGGRRVCSPAHCSRAPAARAASRSWCSPTARIECDAVVVGVGTVPATGWLRGSGLGDTECEVDAAGAPRSPTSSPPGTPRFPSIPASGSTPGPSTGTPPPGRAPPRPRRCSARSRGRRRCRASGATSTASASSPSATPHLADAVVVEGDPAARDFEAVFIRDGAPRRRPRGRPAAGDPGAAAS